MCCKDCIKRDFGCHDKCDDYKEYKKDLELKNKYNKDCNTNLAISWDNYYKHKVKRNGTYKRKSLCSL